ncbi:MAG: hypothetical protein L3J39_02390 [Verrucomicrobiales bacterium]|nr:hypothetical protein [Verrucomicrobiales bacterium]
MTQRRKIQFWAMGLLFLWLAATFIYNQRDSFQCSFCFSRKAEFTWMLGRWAGESISLSSKTERIRESLIYRDYFNNSHRHHWKFRQGSPYYFFGLAWGGCALGSAGEGNDFTNLYKQLSGYRSFIAAKIERGELLQENVLRLIELPSDLEWEQADLEDRKWLELIESLLDEYIEQRAVDF